MDRLYLEASGLAATHSLLERTLQNAGTHFLRICARLQEPRDVGCHLVQLIGVCELLDEQRPDLCQVVLLRGGLLRRCLGCFGLGGDVRRRLGRRGLGRGNLRGGRTGRADLHMLSEGPEKQENNQQ